MYSTTEIVVVLLCWGQAADRLTGFKGEKPVWSAVPVNQTPGTSPPTWSLHPPCPHEVVAVPPQWVWQHTFLCPPPHFPWLPVDININKWHWQVYCCRREPTRTFLAAVGGVKNLMCSFAQMFGFWPVHEGLAVHLPFVRLPPVSQLIFPV